jgi:hypothetical protein
MRAIFADPAPHARRIADACFARGLRPRRPKSIFPSAELWQFERAMLPALPAWNPAFRLDSSWSATLRKFQPLNTGRRSCVPAKPAGRNRSGAVPAAAQRHEHVDFRTRPRRFRLRKCCARFNKGALSIQDTEEVRRTHTVPCPRQFNRFLGSFKRRFQRGVPIPLRRIVGQRRLGFFKSGEERLVKLRQRAIDPLWAELPCPLPADPHAQAAEVRRFQLHW